MDETIKKLSEPLPDEEIELRIGSTFPEKGFTLLAYKTARTDIHRLNDVCGIYWRNRFFYDQKDLLCCEIEIYDIDTNQWIGRSDVGVESFTEKEKGSYSDARKRAGFCWGIGIELYKFPFIYIAWENWYEKNGKHYPKGCYPNEWKIDRSSEKIVIRDKNSNIIWSETSKSQRSEQKTKNESKDTDQKSSSSLFDKSDAEHCGSWKILKGKHTGKTLCELPDGTLKWYAENMDVGSEWYDVANLEIHRRNSQQVAKEIGEKQDDQELQNKIRKAWDFLNWSNDEIRDDCRDQGFDSPIELKKADYETLKKYHNHLLAINCKREIKRGWKSLEWDSVHIERSLSKHLEMTVKEFESSEDLKALEKYYEHLMNVE